MMLFLQTFTATPAPSHHERSSRGQWNCIIACYISQDTTLKQSMINSTEKASETNATLSISLMTPSSMSTTIALACNILNQLSQHEGPLAAHHRLWMESTLRGSCCPPFKPSLQG